MSLRTTSHARSRWTIWPREAAAPGGASGLLQRPADPPPSQLAPFLRWALGGSYGALGLLAAFSLGVGIAEVAIFAMMGGLVDRAVEASRETFFADEWPWLAALAFLIVVMRPVTQLGQSAMTSLVIGPGLNPMTIWRLHRHTLGQSMRYFEEDFTGRIAQKQTQTAMALTTVAIDTLTALGMLVAFLVAMAGFLGAAEPWLALMVALWAAGFTGTLLWGVPKIRARAKARAAARATVSGQLVDSLSHIKTVKLFAHAHREEAAALGTLERYHAAGLAFGRMIMALRIILAVLNTVVTLAIVGGALWFWSAGEASIGVVAMAAMMTLRLAQMSGWMAQSALTIFGELGTIEDGAHTLSPAHELTDRERAVEPFAAPSATAAQAATSSAAVPAAAAALASASPSAAYTTGRRASEGPAPIVRFDGVTFRYGRTVGGVAGLDLSIGAGEKVGLVGRSGAGKSTVVSLLLRLYDVEAGRVLVGGTDVRDLTQDGLRRVIATVTQETAIFNRSALDNVLYGRPDAGHEAALEAARRARADEFIRDLRDGQGRTAYDAHLGERGVKLSGGQRQRIALARAILKDAPILVLDEATSALDSEVEADIQEALSEVMRGKTVLAIAHRLSTIAAMDRIVVMDDGRVVEEGPHAVLLSRGGRYADLWSRQSGGFLLAAE